MTIKIKIKEGTERYFELKYYTGVQYGIDSSLWRSFCTGNEIEVDSMPDGLEDKVDIL